MKNPEKKNSKRDRSTVRRIVALFAPHRPALTVMLLAVAVGVGLGLVPPFFIQRIIDDGLQHRDLSVTAFYSVLTILVTLMAASVTLLYGFMSVRIGQKIMCQMRRDLFVHLQGMSLRFFTGARTGDIQTRLISDIGGIQNVVCNTFVDAISNVGIVISALVAMFIMDWRLTLLAVSLIPLFAVVGNWLGEFARKVRKGTQEQTSELNSLMQENLSVSGALLGKTIGQARVVADRFEIENQKLAEWQIKSSVLQYVFFGMIRMITQLAPALIYWLAGWLIFRGDRSITVGLLVAFSALQTRMFFPLTGIMGLQVEIMGSLALFDRIFEYMDMPHDVTDAPDALPLPVGAQAGTVKLEDVGFKYDREADDWTLRGINLEAKSGELVALVGPSGAGKTTITYLIARLYDADAGRVMIGGTDVTKIRLADLHRNVGMVTQETYLIHTTIRENLRLAKPEATDEELVAACRAAAIHDHIDSLPEGYDTVVGERGYKLSGGEKQRIAIARAVLKNPPILILDEATSALDTETERQIQSSLAGLMQGRTTFAIAHRLSTIVKADQILVVRDGQIVERGRHDQLMETGEIYAGLVQQQFAVTP